MNKPKLINLRTSDELFNSLTEISIKNKKNLSETIRIALTEYVNKQNNKYAEFESYLNQGE